MRSDRSAAPGHLQVPPAFEDVRDPPAAPTEDADVRFESLLNELGQIRDDFEQLEKRVRARG